MNNTTVFGNPLIIERPEWQSMRQKTIYGTITLGFWVIWGYLFSPILSAIAWLFGLEIAYENMIGLGGYKGFLQLTAYYLLIIILLGGSLLLWASYNYYRFRGVDRRRARPEVDVTDLSVLFDLDASLLTEWQDHKKLTVYHDTHGLIVGIQSPVDKWIRKNPEKDSKKAKVETMAEAVD